MRLVRVRLEGVEEIANSYGADRITREARRHEGTFLVLGSTAIPFFGVPYVSRDQVALDLREPSNKRSLAGVARDPPKVHYADGRMEYFRRDGILGSFSAESP